VAARSASAGGWRAPRARPYLALSLLVHAALLWALYLWGPQPTKPLPPEQRQARMTAALEQARRTQMQRQVRSLQEMQQKLAARTGENAGEKTNEGESRSEPKAALPTDPQALLQRAQALADQIKQTEQKARAAELARLLKIKPEAALAQIKAEEKKQAAANPPPAPKTPAAAIAQLEQQARSALERQQLRDKQREQGTLLVAQNATGSKQQTGPIDKAKGASTGAGLNAGSSSSGSSSQGTGGASSGGQAGQGLPSAGGGFSDPRVYGALLKSSDINGQTLRVGAGRVLGPGGPVATRVYLNSWYILGPFEGLSSDSLKEIYPPEVGGGAGVDLDAAYEGLRGRVLQWRYQTSAAYPFVPQPRAENAVYFAYTEVMVDEAREVWLEFGADDDSKLWLNDDLVWTSGNANKPWYRQPFYTLKDDINKLKLVEGMQRVKLRAGRNALLLKLYNGIDLMFFSVVLSPVNPNP
jgi:hypothetical protein